MTSIAIENPSQTDATDDAQLKASFARQPILNRDGMLCGYELKVRAPALPAVEPDTAEAAADAADSDASVGRQPSPEQQVARAIVQGLVQSDVRFALTGHPAYVDANRELLLDDAILRLPPERFMLQLQPRAVCPGRCGR